MEKATEKDKQRGYSMWCFISCTIRMKVYQGIFCSEYSAYSQRNDGKTSAYLLTASIHLNTNTNM